MNQARRDFLKQALAFGAGSCIPVAVIERAVASFTDEEIAAGVSASTFATMLNEYLPEELLREEMNKTSFISSLPKNTWRGGIMVAPIDFNSPPEKEIPCPVCEKPVMSYSGCKSCMTKAIQFKRGDIIKPIKASRFDADQWRYIVVKVTPAELLVLDFHNNIGFIGREQIPEMEIVEDKDMSEDFYVEVMAGKHDDRF